MTVAKFPAESSSERILKIGNHLAMLRTRLCSLVLFFDSHCIVLTEFGTDHVATYLKFPVKYVRNHF